MMVAVLVLWTVLLIGMGVFSLVEDRTPQRQPADRDARRPARSKHSRREAA